MALISLPDNVLAKILRLSLVGSPSTLAASDVALARVCKDFSKILASFHTVASESLVDIFERGKRVMKRIRSVTRDRSSIRRLALLEETMNLLLEYQPPTSCCHLSCFQKLFEVALTAAQSSTEGLLHVARSGDPLTVNFDIYDLTLRRYYEQLRTLFPPRDSLTPMRLPCDTISDLYARRSWWDAFGERTWYVSWSEFQKFIEAYFGVRSSSVIKERLQFLMNFPKDDMITVYKFETLCSLFGPFEDLPSNFRVYTGPGFLGLINRVQAEEILSRYPREVGVFLMRFSRTLPQFLAFSFKSANTRRVLHTVNASSSGDTVPVSRKIASDFSRFKRVRERLSEDAFEKETPMGYAASKDRYVTVDFFDDDEDDTASVPPKPLKSTLVHSSYSPKSRNEVPALSLPTHPPSCSTSTATSIKVPGHSHNDNDYQLYAPSNQYRAYAAFGADDEEEEEESGAAAGGASQPHRYQSFG